MAATTGAAPMRNSTHTHSPAGSIHWMGVSKFMDGTSARFFLRM
jgi:hypothetical protein